VSKRAAGVAEELKRAQEQLSLVSIDRRDFDDVEGYIVGLGSEWLLMAVLNPAIVLDGYCALRLDDVKRVRHRHNGEMAACALALRHQWPPTAPSTPVALDSVRKLIAAMTTLSPLITVHLEADDPDVCFIGALSELGARSLRLLEVNPRGVWTARPTKYRLDRVTRLDVGGRYEQAVLAFAGDAPIGLSPPDNER
jgi:hypothetical protein